MAGWCGASWSFLGLPGIIGGAWGEPVWKALVALQIAFLLAPSSLAYVWQESSRRRALRAAGDEAYGLAARAATGVLWEEIWSWIGERAVNWRFIGRLTVFVLAMVPLDEAAYAHKWRDDGWAAAVAARTISVVGGVAELTLLCLLIAAGVRWVVRPIPAENLKAMLSVWTGGR